MKKFYLVRHGLSVANQDKIVQGQTDFPLSEEGRQQSVKLASHFSSIIKSPTSIVSSPLQRARETARIIADRLDCPIEYDESWMERQLGDAQGVNYDTVRSWLTSNHLPSAYEPIHGDGESWLALYLRAGQALLNLIERPTGIYIVVSHGGFLNAVIRVILGIAPSSGRSFPPRFSFNNTGYAQLEYDDDFARWSIIRLNSFPHLDIEF
jgi:broad specificity phosphatase PhoE